MTCKRRKTWVRLGAMLLSTTMMFSFLTPISAGASSESDRLVNTIVSKANAEIGYREKGNNITKYGSWYGYQTGWCAIFVLWCVNQADQSLGTKMLGNVIGRQGGCGSMQSWFRGEGGYRSRSSGYTPKKGDIAFFDWNYDGSPDHVGLVTGVSSSSITVTHGNMSDRVRKDTYSRSSGQVLGYGHPDYEAYAQGPGAAALSGIELSTRNLTLNAGSSSTISYTLHGKTKGSTLSWSSSNTGVATVSGGKVTAKTGGTATITAKASNGKTATCKVSVKQGASSISLSRSSLTMSNGSSVRLQASMAPATTTDDITWSSSDTGVVRVDGGRISATGVGKARVTARTSSGRTATCTVSVTPVAATGLKLSTDKKTVNVGESIAVKSEFIPVYATDSVTFSTTDNDIIALSPNGGVQALKPGTATVQAVTEKGVVETIDIFVFSPSEKIRIDRDVALVAQGGQMKLNAILNPPDSTDKLMWSSSNPAVATVDANGVVSAVAAGQAVITVKAESGPTATCEVAVNVPCISMKVNTPDSTLEVYEKLRLDLDIYPTVTTDSVTFTSSDKKVATVSKEGVVTGVSAGEATITCKSSNGIVRNVKITVTRPAAEVKAENALTATGIVSGAGILGLASFFPNWKKRREEEKEFIERVKKITK